MKQIKCENVLVGGDGGGSGSGSGGSGGGGGAHTYGDIIFLNHMFQSFAILSILQLVDLTVVITTTTKIIVPEIIWICVKN